VHGTLDKREPRPALSREDRGLKRKHVVPDKNRTDENCHESCEVQRGWELSRAATARAGLRKNSRAAKKYRAGRHWLTGELIREQGKKIRHRNRLQVNATAPGEKWVLCKEMMLGRVLIEKKIVKDQEYRWRKPTEGKKMKSD
jgi:hypothetical protein